MTTVREAAFELFQERGATVVGYHYGLAFQQAKTSACPDELYCLGTSYYGLDSYHEVTDVDGQAYWVWPGGRPGSWPQDC